VKSSERSKNLRVLKTPSRSNGVCPTQTTSRHAISSLFLLDQWRRLTCGKTEQLIAVGGVRLEGWWTHQIAVFVDYDVVSAGEVRANFASSHRGLVQLSRHAHALTGIFHSHPGFGRGAVEPSSTDLATHARFERAGYPTLGAIFNKDGFVKFFTAGAPFEVQVIGGGVQEVEANVYRMLTRLRRVPLRTFGDA